MNHAGMAKKKLGVGLIAEGRADTLPQEVSGSRSDVLFFRAQTLAIVRHFFEISCQIGRLPSILGREFFRAKVSHHGIPSFEDQAVFVYDVEQALAQLSPQNLEIVSMVGLYQYSLEEVAKLLGRCRSTVVERYVEGVDTLAQIFLATGMLREDRPDRRIQRFDLDETRRGAAELPSRKPVASANVEPSMAVAKAGSKYPAAVQHRVV